MRSLTRALQTWVQNISSRRVGGAQSDVAEAGDAGVAFAVIALAAIGGPPHQLDVVAGGVLEGDEASHPAHLRFFRRADTDRMAEAIELGAAVSRSVRSATSNAAV